MSTYSSSDGEDDMLVNTGSTLIQSLNMVAISNQITASKYKIAKQLMLKYSFKK